MNLFKEEKSYAKDIPLSIEVLFRENYQAGFSNKYHYHDYYELIFCVTGQFNVASFSKTVPLQSGEIAFIKNNAPHGIKYISSNSSHICIKFDKNILFPNNDIFFTKLYYSKLLQNLNDITFITPAAFQQNYEVVKSAFFAAYNEFSNKRKCYEMLLRAHLLEIVATILDTIDNQEDFSVNLKASSFALKIEQYILDNLSTVTLANVAKHFSINYSYFSKMFKAVFGETFSNYVTQKRIHKSMDLLSETSMNITEIALTVGFSTSSHFTEVFRRMQGTTPNNFRKHVSIK